MLKKKTAEDILLDTFIYVFLILLSMTTLIPFLQVITVSLSPPADLGKYGLHLFPRHFDLTGYNIVFKDSLIWRAYYNTILRTVIGTSLNVFMTFLGAYPLSKKNLPHKNFWTGFLILTMFFNGGLIPNYILVTRLHLRNTIWSLILPGLINTYNLVIVRNFIMALPDSLEEAARIDGANEFQVLLKVILPLSKPIIATIALWYGVAHWNQWFDCMLYINSQKKHVLQLVLRRILLEGKLESFDLSRDAMAANPESMKMATLLVATLPIICVYPFLQKYFVKGVLVGSLKG